jgi:hypothetical protein
MSVTADLCLWPLVRFFRIVPYLGKQALKGLLHEIETG